MSQNPSLLSSAQAATHAPETGITDPEAFYRLVNFMIQVEMGKDWSKLNLNVPEGTERFTSKRVSGGGVVAGLTVWRSDGEFKTYGELNKVYASVQEAKNHIYRLAYNMGVIEFIRSGHPQGPPPPYASVASPPSLPATEPGPSAPVALSQEPSEVANRALDLPGTSSTHLPLNSTQPLVAPEETNLPANQPTEVHPEANALSLAPPAAAPAPLTNTLEGPNAKAPAGLADLVSSLINRLAATVSWPASSSNGRKRAYPDEEIATTSGSIQGRKFRELPTKKRKTVSGESYTRILADRCEQSTIDQPLIGCQQWLGDWEMYRMSATVGSQQFQLLELCDSIEAGEEILSKHILETLGVDAIID